MGWTHLEDRTPVGRKDHQCYLCELTIPKGQKHVCRTGITDDGPTTFRMHTICEAISRSWDESDWESGHDAADFRQTLDEMAKAKVVSDG